MRIVVAEDAVLLRVGLVRVLDDAGEDVVAAVGDAPSLLLAVESHRPISRSSTSECHPT